MPKNINFKIVALGIACGILLTLLPGLVFCAGLTCFIFYFAARNTAAEDKKFVTGIMASALLLRLGVFIILQYYCFEAGKLDLFGDGQDNINKGIQIYNYLAGLSPQIIKLNLIWAHGYNVHGKTFANGIFFALFGKDAICVKYINMLAVVGSGWFIYDMAKNICSGLAGKIALVICVFWPSLFAWSITDLKDSHVVFALVLMFWGSDKFIAETAPFKRILFLLCGAIGALYALLLRFQLFLLVISFAVMIFALYLLFRAAARSRDLRILKTVLLAGAICFALLAAKNTLFYNGKIVYGKIISMNRGFLASGGFNYNLLGSGENLYTAGFFFKYVFQAWLHFMLEPLPFGVISFSMFAYYPQLAIWYCMLGASMVGIVRICQLKRFTRIFFPCAFLIVYITVVGMIVANIGTAVRMRDSIMPVVAILASSGLIAVFRPKEIH